MGFVDSAAQRASCEYKESQESRVVEVNLETLFELSLGIRDNYSSVFRT